MQTQRKSHNGTMLRYDQSMLHTQVLHKKTDWLPCLRRELAILSPGAIEPRRSASLPSVDSYHQRCTFRTLLRVEMN